jgi:hypothetical protein
VSALKNDEVMNDEKIIRDFESDALPPDSFHHADHVRVAFAYLRRYPVLEALRKFTSALQRFATARGKPQLYNETITYAYFFLIHERMALHGAGDWQEFSAANPDLLASKNAILSHYYRDNTLSTDLARAVFVLPDRLSGQ